MDTPGIETAIRERGGPEAFAQGRRDGAGRPSPSWRSPASVTVPAYEPMA